MKHSVVVIIVIAIVIGSLPIGIGIAHMLSAPHKGYYIKGLHSNASDLMKRTGAVATIMLLLTSCYLIGYGSYTAFAPPARADDMDYKTVMGNLAFVAVLLVSVVIVLVLSKHAYKHSLRLVKDCDELVQTMKRRAQVLERAMTQAEDACEASHTEQFNRANELLRRLAQEKKQYARALSEKGEECDNAMTQEQEARARDKERYASALVDCDEEIEQLKDEQKETNEQGARAVQGLLGEAVAREREKQRKFLSDVVSNVRLKLDRKIPSA